MRRMVYAALAGSMLLASPAHSAPEEPAWMKPYVNQNRQYAVNYEEAHKSTRILTTQPRKRKQKPRPVLQAAHPAPTAAERRFNEWQKKEPIARILASQAASQQFPNFLFVGDTVCTGFTFYDKERGGHLNGEPFGGPVELLFNSVVSVGDCLFGLSEMVMSPPQEKGAVFVVRGPIAHAGLIAGIIFPQIGIPALLGINVGSMLINNAFDHRHK